MARNLIAWANSSAVWIAPEWFAAEATYVPPPRTRRPQPNPDGND